MSKFNFSRRNLFGAAAATVASQVGTSLLFNSTLGSSALVKSLRKSVESGVALAAPAVTPVDRPVAGVVLSAKSDANMLYRADSPAVGCVGNPNYALSTVFAQFQLAKFFGDYLAEIESTHAMSLIPVGKGPGANGGGGNHDYNAVVMEQSKTGTLAYYIGKSKGDLVANLSFGVNATADTATAVIADGGTQLISYNSVGGAADAISGAVEPLKAPPAHALKVTEALNTLVTKDTAFKARLGELGEVLAGTVAPLNAAKTLAATNPAAMQMTDYMNPDIVRLHNPLLLQLAVAEPLFNNGLTTAATFCIGSSDVNGGGDYTAAGGNNTDRRGVSAITAKAMLGQFITEFVKKYPKGVVVWTGEGGRAANGGDTNIAFSGIVGPKDMMDSVFIGESVYATSTNFNQAVPVDLNNGSRGNPTIANLFATAAKIAGYDFGPHAIIKGIAKAS